MAALFNGLQLKCAQAASILSHSGALYGVVQQSLRFYPKSRYARTKVRIPPKKPDFSYSGDLVTTLPAVDLTLPRADFVGCPQFDSVDEVTKKKLSLEYADHQEVMKHIVNQMSDKFGRHPGDTTSIEAKIAIITVKIRNQIRHVMSFPKDKLHKAQLVEAIQRRAKWLKQLRDNDVQRFEWLCSELQLKWSPPSEYHRHIPKAKVERFAAVSQTLDLKKKRIEELRKQLDKERSQFYDGGEAAALQDLEKELQAVAAERTALASRGHDTGYSQTSAADGQQLSVSGASSGASSPVGQSPVAGGTAV